MTEPDRCFHLPVVIVQRIHAASIARFGGATELRSQVLLESAIAAPHASLVGKPAFSDVIEAAAAYLFYLCNNHPFVNGNKRTALGACIVFLKLNGATPAPDSNDWESLTMDVAAGKLDRAETTARLRTLVDAS